MWNKFRRVVDPQVFSPRKDFHLKVGETFYMDVFIYEGIEVDEYDVGDTPVVFEAKDDPYAPTLTLTKDRDAGIIVMDEDNGYVRIEFTVEDTEILGDTGGRLVYDVSITDDEGTTFVVAYGSLFLGPPTY
jgi:hypothetical protein